MSRAIHLTDDLRTVLCGAADASVASMTRLRPCATCSECLGLDTTQEYAQVREQEKT